MITNLRLVKYLKVILSNGDHVVLIHDIVLATSQLRLWGAGKAPLMGYLDIDSDGDFTGKIMYGCKLGMKLTARIESWTREIEIKNNEIIH